MPPVHGSVVRIHRMMRMQHFWIRTAPSSTVAALHARIGGRLLVWQTPKCISSVSFVRIESNFFTIHRRNRPKKRWTRILNSVIFENFFKFSKRHRTVPLRSIWTIMVVAKLDHSRVLVTKFYQNRSMFKGRSAGQRHTDR